VVSRDSERLRDSLKGARHQLVDTFFDIVLLQSLQGRSVRLAAALSSRF